MNTTKTTPHSFYLILLLFFIFGFITWVNGVLVPYLKLACELEDWQAYLVTTAFYLPYPLMAIPSASILQFIGYKKGMSIGLLIVALGSLLFIPAAYERKYSYFLIGLFIQGSGLSLLQTAANPYVTIVGPIERAAQRISIMGIGNKVAGILGALILGHLVLSDVDVLTATLSDLSEMAKASELDALAQRVIFPYIWITLALVGLSIFLMWVSLPEPELIQQKDDVRSDYRGLKQFPYLWIGVVALFLYVGAEVIAGDTITVYATEKWNIPLSTSKSFTSLTLISMLVGYGIGVICIPKYITQQQMLSISAGLGIVLTLGIVVFEGMYSVACVALLGAANAIVWPAIWPLAIEGLKEYTAKGSAFLIMGISGGALLPLLYGWFTSISFIGQQYAYGILLPCYLFILYFARKGHTLGKKII
ncbi:MAG: sugar MFS transporter [Cytophagaceae bacterium]|jgi:glucose/galactose transporter|nr:sugar MFS transporter [Cytophagaceae bacterium]